MSIVPWMRSASGVAAKRASMLFAPMAASIAVTSSAVCGMYAIGLVLVLRAVLVVGGRVEQPAGLRARVFDFDHPARAVRILRHRLGRPRQRAVGRLDRAGHRG